MRCPHCEKSIRPAQPTFTYPESKVVAHLSCVSTPSIAAMDALLLEAKRRDASPTRRVYSTETGFTNGTETGRFRGGRNRSARPRER